MTKLYFVRHAEAEGNVYRRIHGQYDSTLTPNGEKQLEFLQERFQSIPFDVLYSSDLCRARYTAEALGKAKGLLPITRQDLREINMGIWEDRTWGEIDHEDPKTIRLFRESSPKWSVKGGETFQALQDRIHTALLDIIAQHPNQTVVIAFHGTAIRFGMAALLGLSVAESRDLPHSDNTAVSLFEIDGTEVKAVFTDDNSHLPEAYSTLARQTWWKAGKDFHPDENLWFTPMDFSEFLYKGLYLASRQEAWTDLKRDLQYFGRQPYLSQAEACYERDPKHLLCVMQKNTIVGILQLDAERYEDENIGYISFFYMLPEYRNQGLGIQILGEAISVYRAMGRDKIALICGSDNEKGLSFYQRQGFYSIDQGDAGFAQLNLLQKDIGLPQSMQK